MWETWYTVMMQALRERELPCKRKPTTMHRHTNIHDGGSVAGLLLLNAAIGAPS